MNCKDPLIHDIIQNFVQSPDFMGINVEKLIGIPVYISMTTISSRIQYLPKTLSTLLNGTISPTRIYVVVSRDPFLIDEGISELPHELMYFVHHYPVSIAFTKNFGPHRKLLPVLEKYWNQNCLIATFDDDLRSSPDRQLLENLLSAYNSSGGKSVVALRNRRIGLCVNSPHRLLEYRRFWPVYSRPFSTEIFLLPTGTGGVLYHPKFFHSIVFDEALRGLTITGDDLMFRLATMAKGVKVTMGCSNLFTKKHALKHACPRHPAITSLLAHKPSQLLLDQLSPTYPPEYLSEVQFVPTHWFNHSSFSLSSFSSVSSSNNDSFMLFDQKQGEGEQEEEEEEAEEIREEDQMTEDETSLSSARLLFSHSSSSSTSPRSSNHHLNHSSLYSHNMRGKNEKQWQAAATYLTRMKVMDFSSLVDRYLMRDRGKTCATSPLLSSTRLLEDHSSSSSPFSSPSKRDLWRCGMKYCK